MVTNSRKIYIIYYDDVTVTYSASNKAHGLW